MLPVSITWAGGEHSFLLKIAHLRALQQKCDAGPAWILSRLGSGNWYVDDVIQPIRLGLEGGGMDKREAAGLVQKHVEEQPLTESVLTAHAVLVLSLYGESDDPVGEPEAGERVKAPSDSATENGGSPGSSAPAPSSDSLPQTSTQ